MTIAKNNYYTIEINQLKNRAYLTLMGYWNNPSDFISDIEFGIRKLSTGFTTLVNLTQYTGTSKELLNLHVDAQKISVEAGLSRVAEVFSRNPLVLKLFADSYAKESGAMTMAFQDTSQSEKWLDLY